MWGAARHGALFTTELIAVLALVVLGVFGLVHLVWNALCGERWARIALVGVIAVTTIAAGAGISVGLDWLKR